MCVFEPVNKMECELEYEKTLVKTRWTSKDYTNMNGESIIKESQIQENTQNYNKNPFENEEENEERQEWPIDRINKTVDMSILRPTDIPNKSISLPPPLKPNKELKLQKLKQELIETTEEYIRETNQEHKINKTTTYDINLSKEQIKGIKSLQENKDIIVFTTDKTGTFTADTPENYREATEIHTTNDIEITEAEHQRCQKEANAHATIWTRIVNAGANNTSQTAQERIKANLLVENSGYAPLYSLRKDHKQCDDQIKGPKTRPVCGGSNAYNRKLAHFISIMIRPIWQDEESVCTNTEEMMAAIHEEVNSKNIKTEILVGSADVKALYPSLDIDHTAEIVAEMFFESEYQIKEVDARELSLYLALNMKTSEIEKENIKEYCHTRTNKKGAPPVITGCAIHNNPTNRYKPWDEPKQEPDETTTKKMMSIALKIVIKFIMKNHIYKINDKIKKQTKGGPIGLELTGDIAQIYMCWWDKQMKIRLAESNIILLLYKRYVDDINFIIDKQKAIRENRDEKEDLEIIERIRQIGNSIHKSIEIETDTPAQHEDKKQPILDLKVWSETRKEKDGSISSKVIHEFYHKEIANKAVTNAQSAMSPKAKRDILTAEMLRVFLRCSPLLEWSITAKHASTMNLRIQNAGYDQKFREQITKSALNKYKDIINKDKSGECPLYRNKEWNKAERIKKKQQNKTKWYQKGKNKYVSVLFIPATPNSKLQKLCNRVIRKHNVNIKVIEKSGKQVKDILQTSDPFKPNKCPDEDCFVCKNNTKTKSTNCRKEGIVYNIKCNQCPAKYVGESARNAISRGREHFRDYLNNRDSSVMLRHSKTHHPNFDPNNPNYTMTVKQIYGNRSMDRQISESIQINNVPQIDLINNKLEHIQQKLPRAALTWE